jgi:hypothetical protein
MKFNIIVALHTALACDDCDPELHASAHAEPTDPKYFDSPVIPFFDSAA